MIPVYNPSERPDWMTGPATIRELAAAQQYEQMQQQQPLIQAVLRKLLGGQQAQAGGMRGGYGGMQRPSSGAYMPQSFQQSYQTGPGMMDFAFRPTANAPQKRNPKRARNAWWDEEDRLLAEEEQAIREMAQQHAQQAQRYRQQDAGRQPQPRPQVPTMGEQTYRRTRQTFGNLW
jgi:hypothetical protein